MTDFIPAEKGMPIRPPATANLMIDSLDRVDVNNTSPWSFTIQKRQSILNGYFTRIGVTEVVLDWKEPNIITGGNDTITLNASTSTIPQGNYTVAQVLDHIVSDLSGAVAGLRVTTGAGQVALVATNPYTVTAGLLQNALGLSLPAAASHIVSSQSDLRIVRYLDFTSSQLTYCQDVKDATTSPNDRNVLCRWYMSWDNPPTYDKYGFPILMGYSAFSCRRLFNPPKQIRWSPNQPVGQLQFQVFPDSGAIYYSENVMEDIGTSDWLMTLQVSET